MTSRAPKATWLDGIESRAVMIAATIHGHSIFSMRGFSLQNKTPVKHRRAFFLADTNQTKGIKRGALTLVAGVRSAKPLHAKMRISH